MLNTSRRAIKPNKIVPVPSISPRIQAIEQQWLSRCLGTQYIHCDYPSVSVRLLGVNEKSPLTIDHVKEVRKQLDGQNLTLAAYYTQHQLTHYQSFWAPFYKEASTIQAEIPLAGKIQLLAHKKIVDLQNEKLTGLVGGLGVISSIQLLGTPYMPDIFAWDADPEEVLSLKEKLNAPIGLYKYTDKWFGSIVAAKLRSQQLDFDIQLRSVAHQLLKNNPSYVRAIQQTNKNVEGVASARQKVFSHLAQNTLSVLPMEMKRINDIVQFWTHGSYRMNVINPSRRILGMIQKEFEKGSSRERTFIVSTPRGISIELESWLKSDYKKKLC